MDKELLRVVIIATGLLVILAMLVWHFLKNRKFSGGESLYGNLPLGRKTDDTVALRPGQNELDDFDLAAAPRHRYAESEQRSVTDPTPLSEDDCSDFFAEESETAEAQPQPPRFSLPEIIQFCLMAKHDQGFNGLDLLNAFQIAHLEYGTLKIFERLDANRLVDFGVACMVDSGTFPETGMETFHCPGLVFFMQPSMVDEPGAVFDDFVDTIKLLAIELDGEALDHRRQPLTEKTIQLFQHSLSLHYS